MNQEQNKKPARVVVAGADSHARLLAQAVVAAGMKVELADMSSQSQMHDLKPPRAPSPTPWNTGTRKRAQWKDETNQRGRNR